MAGTKAKEIINHQPIIGEESDSNPKRDEEFSWSARPRNLKVISIYFDWVLLIQCLDMS